MQNGTARVACLYGILILFALESHAAGPFRIGGPATIDNDASCDISLLPAATLLLPYFEVDINSWAGTGENTIFTITNTGQLPQVARVTLWTDLSYPVISFNIYLTGYDVQSINLYDVIARGEIAPDDGTGADVSPVGELSGTSATKEFNNPLVDELTCTDLVVQMAPPYVTRMKSAFTTGKVLTAGELGACAQGGSAHSNAVGYATVDVVGRCGITMPNDPVYFANDIRFDNVLMGDFHQINGNEDFAQGGTMVHIRAIPEGGTPQTRDDDRDFEVHVPRTFYSAYQDPARPTLDARQPLPSLFAARWISGGPSGFETDYKIWREVGREPDSCRAHASNTQEFREIVRFDEEENAEVFRYECVVTCPAYVSSLPATSRVSVAHDSDLPQSSQGVVSGWMYLNLDDRVRDDIARQAWVVVSMRADDRFSTDFDALALGNGCTAPLGTSEANHGDFHIGPARNKRN